MPSGLPFPPCNYDDARAMILPTPHLLSPWSGAPQPPQPCMCLVFTTQIFAVVSPLFIAFPHMSARAICHRRHRHMFTVALTHLWFLSTTCPCWSLRRSTASSHFCSPVSNIGAPLPPLPCSVNAFRSDECHGARYVCRGILRLRVVHSRNR